MRLISAFAIAFALCMGAADSGYGAIIDGEMNITGAARVTSTQIDFLPLAGGDGEFEVSPLAPGTGYFAGFGGEDGLIKDLMLPGDPVGVLFSKPDFLTFLTIPGLSFELTFIEPGVSGVAECGPPADVGDICTPPGSPFNLQNTVAGWTASFGVAGFVSDGSSDPASPFTGTFTTQNTTGQRFEDLLAIINAGGFVQASYSAQFDANGSGLAPIPEPGSVFLIGAGLLGLGFIRRRRN